MAASIPTPAATGNDAVGTSRAVWHGLSLLRWARMTGIDQPGLCAVAQALEQEERARSAVVFAVFEAISNQGRREVQQAEPVRCASTASSAAR